MGTHTYVRDAHYAEMHFSERTNVGKLMRKELGAAKAFIVAFGFLQGLIYRCGKMATT
jgi:hypothetical protein